MGRKQKMRIALLLAALVALSALWGLAEPARKTLTIQLEGMPEEMPVTEYRLEGLYTVWYDADHFLPVPLENGIRFELMDNRLSAEVSFSIEDTWDPGRTDESGLADFREEYERQGWACEGIDAVGMLPLFSFPDDPVQGFAAIKDRQEALVYLAWAASGTYLCTLRYPLEAAEGWGTRMHFMLNTLEALPGE